MRNNESGYTSDSLLALILFVFGAVGWAANIVKLAESDFAVNSGMFIVRIVGIFVAPLGAVLGYC